MAGFEKGARRYPTDLTDEEWRFIQPFLPPVPKRERKPKTDLREVLDALRYLARTAAAAGGCCTRFDRNLKNFMGAVSLAAAVSGGCESEPQNIHL